MTAALLEQGNGLFEMGIHNTDLIPFEHAHHRDYDPTLVASMGNHLGETSLIELDAEPFDQLASVVARARQELHDRCPV